MASEEMVMMMTNSVANANVNCVCSLMRDPHYHPGTCNHNPKQFQSVNHLFFCAIVLQGHPLRDHSQSNRRPKSSEAIRLSKKHGFHLDRKSTRLNSSHVAISYAV